MISGRGLGHTGGTLDKMDSIPGYTTQPDNQLFRKVVDEAGCAIIGQTSRSGAGRQAVLRRARRHRDGGEHPADHRVDILSKKLAAGLQSLVLDVKFGGGAFMADYDKAKSLAETLVKVANGAGTRKMALMTDMNQPLASAAGNAVEVVNAVEFLTGAHRDPRLEEVTLSLAAEMLVISGAEPDGKRARSRAKAALDDGDAADTFGRMVHALGGPADFVGRYDHYLAKAPIVIPVAASRSGYVRSVQTRSVGISVVELGGGRRVSSDEIDHAVGLTALLPVGTRVEKGEPLCMVHARNEAALEAARSRIMVAYAVGDEKPEARKPVELRIG
jgi:thymidine phosphorylase